MELFTPSGNNYPSRGEKLPFRVKITPPRPAAQNKIFFSRVPIKNFSRVAVPLDCQEESLESRNSRAGASPLDDIRASHRSPTWAMSEDRSVFLTRDCTKSVNALKTQRVDVPIMDIPLTRIANRGASIDAGRSQAMARSPFERDLPEVLTCKQVAMQISFIATNLRMGPFSGWGGGAGADHPETEAASDDVSLSSPVGTQLVPEYFRFSRWDPASHVNPYGGLNP